MNRGASMNHGPQGPAVHGKLSLMPLIAQSATWDQAEPRVTA